MHGTIRLERHELIIFVIIISHVIFSFSLKRFRFYKFCKTSFFNVMFVLKIIIVFVFVSVNDGQSIFVFVIVAVTEISLPVYRST